MTMRTIRARIHDGRLVSVEPVPLPEGAEVDVAVPMETPSVPTGSTELDDRQRIEAAFALMDAWEKEPGDYDERVLPIIERELEKDPLTFRDLNIELERGP